MCGYLLLFVVLAAAFLYEARWMPEEEDTNDR